MAIDKVTTPAIADANITTAKLAYDAAPFRNIIINGDMSLAQRSTSVSSISSGNTIHTCDRWKTYASSAGTWTQTQEALTSGDAYTNGFATSLKLDCTTANGSLSSGSYLSVAQSIEAQNLQYIKKGTSNAEQLTASFWVKSTKTGTNIVQFVSLDDTVRICAQSYTISSSDTWEKKTITIPADTSSTGNISNDNGEGLRMIFWVVAGTDYTSGTLATTWADTANANRAVGQVNNADSTSNNFEITGVQLEIGDAASDFEFLPVDVNINRCQRYFYKKVSINAYGPLCQGMQIGGSDCMMQGYHPVKMRSSPSLSISGTWAVESGTTNATFALGTTRSNLFGWSNQQSITATDGSAAIIYGSNDASATFTAEAEL